MEATRSRSSLHRYYRRMLFICSCGPCYQTMRTLVLLTRLGILLDIIFFVFAGFRAVAMAAGIIDPAPADPVKNPPKQVLLNCPISIFATTQSCAHSSTQVHAGDSGAHSKPTGAVLRPQFEAAVVCRGMPCPLSHMSMTMVLAEWAPHPQPFRLPCCSLLVVHDHGREEAQCTWGQWMWSCVSSGAVQR